MKRNEIKIIEITPTSGVLICVAQNENGNYELNGERYSIAASNKVLAPEADVENWSEHESLEAFIEANGYEKI